MGQLLSELVKLAAPILHGAIDLVRWYASVMWEGFKDVVDNTSTIIFVASVCLGSYFYADWKATELAEEKYKRDHAKQWATPPSKKKDTSWIPFN